MKFRSQYLPVSLLLAVNFLSASVVYAQSSTVKVIGATFLEAPPGRDKNLTPFSAGSSQEKVEVNAVVSVKDRMMIDIRGMGSDQSVTATGMLANKTIVPLGSADVGSFPKLSADKKFMSLTLSVARLPDTSPVAVSFVGNVNARVARGLVAKQSAFSIKPESPVDFGIGEVKVEKVEGSVISLRGGPGMERISAIKYISKDGKAHEGERTSWSRMGDRHSVSYKFGVPVTESKLEAALFDGLESVAIPVNITITRPY
jgi:hypothetical protein